MRIWKIQLLLWGVTTLCGQSSPAVWEPLRSELESVAQLQGWFSAATGGIFSKNLEALGSSTDVEGAMVAFEDLMDRVWRAVEEEGRPLEWEGDYRKALRKGIEIGLGTALEGKMRWYLGNSHERLEDASGIVIENQYRRAVNLLRSEDGGDIVKFHLARFLWPEIGAEAGRSEDLRKGEEAEELLDFVLKSEEAARYHAEAEDILESIRKQEFALRGGFSFLPETMVEIPIVYRNMDEISWELNLLAEDTEEGSSGNQTSGTWKLDFAREWKETLLNLGVVNRPGRYRLRVASGEIEETREILITRLCAQVVEENASTLFLHVVDMETGSGMQGVQVVDGIGNLLGETGVRGELRIENGSFEEMIDLRMDHPDGPVNLRMTTPSAEGPVLNGFDEMYWLPERWVVRPGESLRLFAVGDGEPSGRLLIPGIGSLQLEEGELGNGLYRIYSVEVPTTAKTGWIRYRDNFGEMVALAMVDTSRPDVPQLMFLDANGRNRSVLEPSGPVTVQALLPGEFPAGTDLEQMALLELVLFEPTPDGAFEEIHRSNRLLGKNEILQGFPLGLPGGLGEAPVNYLRLRIFELDDRELLGEGRAVVSAHLDWVRFQTRRQILRRGEGFQIEFERYFPGGTVAVEPLKGELVIVREVWEKNYIHRKRRHVISEATYAELPERSLLGAAKTDFELLEEGLQTEEVQRVPVLLEGIRTELEVSLTEVGNYQLRFEAERNSRPAHVVESISRVLVVSDDSGDEVLRSPEPILFVEPGEEGRLEVKVLLSEPGGELLIVEHIRDAEGKVGAIAYLAEAEGTLASFMTEVLKEGQEPLGISVTRVLNGNLTELSATAQIYRGKRESWKLEASPDGSVHARGLGANAFWMFGEEPLALWVEQTLEGQKERSRRREVRLASGSIQSSLAQFPVRLPEVATTLVDYPRDPYSGPGVTVVPQPHVWLGSAGSRSQLVPFENNPLSIGEARKAPAGTGLVGIGFAEGGSFGVDFIQLPRRAAVFPELILPARLRHGETVLAEIRLDQRGGEGQQWKVELTESGGIELPTARTRIWNEPAEESQTSFSLPVKATEPGYSRIELAAAVGELSANETVVTEVLKEYPPRQWKFAIRSGVGNLASMEYSGDTLLVSPSLGRVLEEIFLSAMEADPENPWARLLGTCLRETLESQRKEEGETAPIPEGPDFKFQQGPEGGVSWASPDQDDFWASILVYYAHRAFQLSGDRAFLEPEEILELENWLEGQLIEFRDQPELQSLLLWVLAAGSSSPSRLQATVFLELFEESERSDRRGMEALFFVARQYGFWEEVELLRERLNKQAEENLGPFAQLLQSVRLLDGRKYAEAVPGLDAFLNSLPTSIDAMGWPDLWGLLLLLQHFRTEGEIDLSTTIAWQVPGLESSAVSIEVTGANLFQIPVVHSGVNGGEVQAQLVAGDGLLFLGSRESLRLESGEPGKPANFQWIHHFAQPTLFQGPVVREEVVSDESVFMVGDRLERRFTLHSMNPNQYWTLRIPFSGLEEYAGNFEWEFSAGKPAAGAVQPDVLFSFEAQSHRGTGLLRIPETGSVQLRIWTELRHAGQAILPEISLQDPVSGKIIRISEKASLEIRAREPLPAF